jgi:hypothetical protein
MWQPALSPLITEWAKAGQQADCTAYWEAMSRAVAEDAAQHNVPWVSLYNTFNGPKHDEDPREGYIPGDGEHPADVGAAFIADLLSQSGCGYTQP